MNVYRESVIRRRVDASTIKLIELWHSLCMEKIGRQIEVVIANRHESYHSWSFSGEMNTGLPQILENKLVIALLLEQTDSPDFILITHELAHFIIKLQGVMGVVEFNNPVHQIEATLNSFAQHPAVYALQRKYNQDPQTMIDRRCKLNTEMLSNTHEPHDKTTLIERTLSFSDDLLNCSQENRAAMQDALARHEQTNSLVTSVLSIASLFDLTNLEEITPFCLKIINELDLGEQWVVIDEVKGWKEEANRLGN